MAVRLRLIWMPHLLAEFVICAVMTVGLAAFHLVGLTSLLQLTRYHLEHWLSGWPWFDRLAAPLTMILGMFIIHGLEGWAYALLIAQLSGVDLEHALYVSITAYTTAGIDDSHADSSWRLVVAYESLVGFLMIGWSTAFLFATLHRIMTTEETHPLPEGAIAEGVED